MLPECDTFAGRIAPARLQLRAPLGIEQHLMTNTLYARPAARPLVVAATLLVACAAGTARAEHGFRVLHHQPVKLRSHTEAGAVEHVTFDAYGRRFALRVAPNERIRSAVSGLNTTAMPLQGSVEGAPKSWVRITRTGSGWRGLIFDGQDLYAIEPASDMVDSAVQPLDASGAEPVVYRLSDAVLPLDTMSCEVVHPDEESPVDAESTAESAYEHISHELQVKSAALTATRQVRVGVVGDFEFFNLFGSQQSAEEAIVARMNIVDGIFSSQLGVKISLAPPVVFRTVNDPFTRYSASELLTELRSYRASSPVQRSLGLTHLMTGRDLVGDTVGIAYIGTLCQSQHAASLSEGRRSTIHAALVAAHEIGHNFNAPHDGEGACADTPQMFLMAPKLNGSDRFSACSVAQAQPLINTARCLTTYRPPDVRLEIADSSPQAVVGTAFTASFTVRAIGGDDSNDVTVVATLPPSLTLQSATVNGGTCTSGAGTSSCSLGTLAEGDERRVDLTLTPTDPGSFEVTVALESSNDGNPSNDTGSITVQVAAEPAAVTDPPPSGGTTTSAGGGGGGGGRMDYVLLILMSTLLLATRVHPSRAGRRRI
jgi:hypothetical protein